MHSNNCENTMNTFLELDKDEQLGFKTTIHLLTCKKCRTAVRLCTIAQRSSARPLHIPATINNAAIEQIVQKTNPAIELLKDSHVRPISMKRWVISGIALVIALVLFGLFNTNTSGKELQMTIYISVSLFICIYCAFFIGSNLDFFVKKIDKHL